MKKISLLLFVLTCGWTSSFCQCDHIIEFDHPTCYGFNDGSVTVVPSGGSGTYTVTVENESGEVINFAGAPTANTLGAGWYYTTVDDGAGCIDEDSVELINPGIMEPVLVITDPSFPGACDGVVVCDTVLNHQGLYESISYLWSSGPPGGIGATEASSLCAGTYNLVLNDAFGCSGMTDFSLGSLASIDETENRIEVVSAPLTKAVFVRNDYSAESLDFTIFNLSGQQVQAFELNAGENEFALSSLSGMYVYTISLDGETIKRGKLNF